MLQLFEDWPPLGAPVEQLRQITGDFEPLERDGVLLYTFSGELTAVIFHVEVRDGRIAAVGISLGQ